MRKMEKHQMILIEEENPTQFSTDARNQLART